MVDNPNHIIFVKPYKASRRYLPLEALMASHGSSSRKDPDIKFNQFFVWKEFLWGAVAGAFGEGMMHPVDTLKTRVQSQAILIGSQNQKSMLKMVQSIWKTDGVRGFYRGIAPGVTGSLATGATYFGLIESSKKWIEESHPNFSPHWAHFIAGAIGDALGSFIYVPCEVIKLRMQVQGARTSWRSSVIKDGISRKHGVQMYGYYTGMLQAGCSIWKEQGIKGLFAGYWSTLARDVPFAGLMVMSYETLKDFTQHAKQSLSPHSRYNVSSSLEGLILGGLAGGLSAYLTTPLDVIKTRLQVQGSTLRYKGWLNVMRSIWRKEGLKGMFRGSIPRVAWYVPASALTFMTVEFLRESFNQASDDGSLPEVSAFSSVVEKKGSLQKVS